MILIYKLTAQRLTLGRFQYVFDSCHNQAVPISADSSAASAQSTVNHSTTKLYAPVAFIIIKKQEKTLICQMTNKGFYGGEGGI